MNEELCWSQDGRARDCNHMSARILARSPLRNRQADVPGLHRVALSALLSLLMSCHHGEIR